MPCFRATHALLAMPFIRFRLDDLVTQGPSRCACGAPFAAGAWISSTCRAGAVRDEAKSTAGGEGLS